VTGRRSSLGLTVVEVMLALAVIGIITAAFTTAVVGNLRHGQVTGARTEAVQVLNYLGRRAADFRTDRRHKLPVGERGRDVSTRPRQDDGQFHDQ